MAILIKRVFNSIMFRTHTSYGRINLICQMPRKNNDKNYCISRYVKVALFFNVSYAKVVPFLYGI